MERTQKRIISLRYWLIGRGFFSTVRALDLAEHYHVGVRKDGVTPEIDHPVTVAQYLRTLVDGLLYPEETLSASLLHDVCEDYDVEPDEIRAQFGDRVADAVWRLTKTFRGTTKLPELVAQEQATDPIASLVKGADRIHNIQSMVGVFTREKQVSYIEEAETYILPMVKRARRQFPQQEAAYENVKLVLRSQISLIRGIHAAAA